MALPVKSIASTQKWALRLAVGFLIVCACLTFMAGWSFGGGGIKSVVFATLFAGITFGAALLLPFVGHAFGKGAPLTGLMLFCAWAAFTGGEFLGHLMVFSGHRHSDIQSADFSTAKFEDTAKGKAEAEAELDRARKELADLNAANPWFATVSATGLEEQIATKDEAIRQEERRKGCGNKCLRLKAERAELADRLGKVKTRTDHEQAIEAQVAKVMAAREKFAGAQKGDSPALHQANALASLISYDLAPDATARDWANLKIEWFIAFLLTIGPMSLMYVALKDWDAPRRQGKGVLTWAAEFVAWAYRLAGGTSALHVTNTYNGTQDGLSVKDLQNAIAAAQIRAKAA